MRVDFGGKPQTFYVQFNEVNFWSVTGYGLKKVLGFRKRGVLVY